MTAHSHDQVEHEHTDQRWHAHPLITLERLTEAIRTVGFADVWDDMPIEDANGVHSWEASFNSQKFAAAILRAIEDAG